MGLSMNRSQHVPCNKDSLESTVQRDPRAKSIQLPGKRFDGEVAPFPGTLVLSSIHMPSDRQQRDEVVAAIKGKGFQEEADVSDLEHNLFMRSWHLACSP
jgi:hypothetical protein